MSAKAPQPAPNRKANGEIDPTYRKPAPPPPPPPRLQPPSSASLLWLRGEVNQILAERRGGKETMARVIMAGEQYERRLEVENEQLEAENAQLRAELARLRAANPEGTERP